MGVYAEMLVKVKGKVTPAQVRQWSYETTEAFGYENFWLDPEKDRHALAIVKLFMQDGPDIHPEKDETLIRVHLSTRYYGPGYESGNFPLIYVLAQYLEEKIPNSQIFYGGDSSGICATLFDSRARMKLFQHYAREGHQPYRLNGDTGEVCKFCKVRVVQYGWGPNYKAFQCNGCGYKIIIKNGKIEKGYKIGNGFEPVKMRGIAYDIEKHLPPNYGFFVMIFPFENHEGRSNYVSNGKREDIIKVMQDFIARSAIVTGKDRKSVV